MKKSLLVSTALSMALPCTAMAMSPQAHNWTGFYVGGTIGTGSLKTRTINDDGSDSYVIVGDEHLETGTGILGGVTLGYNYQKKNLVLGVEGDLSFSDAENSFGDNYVHGNSKLKSLGTLRARVGYAEGRTMGYITGGLAAANIESQAWLYTKSDDCRAGFKKFLYGWTLGAGIEYALSDRLSIKAEGLYAKFGSKRNLNNSAYCGCAWGFKNSATIARIGLNYKF